MSPNRIFLKLRRAVAFAILFAEWQFGRLVWQVAVGVAGDRVASKLVDEIEARWPCIEGNDEMA